MKKPIRVQKYISECGIASRRHAEDMIRAGLVKINGRTAKLGDTCIPGVHRVTVEGRELKQRRRPEKRYIMLNKPRGFVTTMQDEQGRRCVADLVADCGERVYPVGRLDRDSEGLLLLTNDGEFANCVMHPSRHIAKTYFASVRPQLTPQQIERLESGVVIDGRRTSPAQVKELSREADRSLMEITIFEGRNRQIRKMCEAVGLTVARLKRVAIGNLALGGLKLGKWRDLTRAEVQLVLRDATRPAEPPVQRPR